MTTIILADSMTRYLHYEKLQQSCKESGLTDIKLYSYPGINASKLYNALLTEVLPPSKDETNPKSKSNVNLIILHVGTNDASIGRIDEKVLNICGSIKKAMEYLQDIYPVARIVYSSILKRFDDDDYRGREINSYMRRVCRQNPNFGYLDIRCHFDDESLFRFSETQDYDNPDVVHLTAKGIRKLESEYIRVIRYHFETLKTLKSESNISKEEFITRRRNHNTDNIEVKHFKVTNWEPAMAGEEENINTQQRPGQQFVTRDTDEYKPSIITAYQKERQLLLDRNSKFTLSTAEQESNWTKTQYEKSSELKSSNWSQHEQKTNWGETPTEKFESSNWGQSEQDNLSSLMPQRKRKRARNSESGDSNMRISGVSTSIKKPVTNIHANTSAYVPTMNKG
jgi:hypothetical protein